MTHAIATAPAFATARAFNVALGRLASAPDALQTAVQHAAMHALHDGQCTPANRFRATLASAHIGLSSGESMLGSLFSASSNDRLDCGPHRPAESFVPLRVFITRAARVTRSSHTG